MKKFFSMIMIAAAVFAFAACEKGGDDTGSTGNGTGTKQQLATPQLSETHTETSITVTWAPVENAEAYKVGLGGKYYDTEECTYTFQNLNAGTYEILVMALADGYTNSEIAKISVELTGATSVDWFTQTLSKITTPVEVEDANGNKSIVNGYDGFSYSWKGTDVVDVSAGIFPTASLEGVTTNDIKKELQLVHESIVADINSETGYEGVVAGCVGSTSYTMCVLVKNKAGVEFFTKNDITTDEAIASDETKAWFGEWTCTTEKIFTYKGNTVPIKNCFSDKTVEHTLSISHYEGYVDRLLVTGFSAVGDEFPAIGYIYKGENGENILALMNEAVIGIDDGYYQTWVSCGEFSDGEYNFMLGEFPVYMLIMDADGTVRSESVTEKITYNKEGATFTPMAYGMLAWDGNTSLAFYQDENENLYPFYAGPMKNIAKKAATPSMVNVRSKKNYSLSSAVATSVVYSL